MKNKLIEFAGILYNEQAKEMIVSIDKGRQLSKKRAKKRKSDLFFL